jgi:20S proteasome alpha/beta subunit
MTLIVGVLCADGCVIAADSAATYGTPANSQTIAQQTQKIQLIEKSGLIAVSGAIGLAQRFHNDVDRMWTTGEFKGTKVANAVDAGVRISEAFKKHIFSEMQIAQHTARLGYSSAGGIASAIVALPIAGRHCLIQFDVNGGPEVATQNLPFVSIGIGQPTADPFLAFLRKVFWKKSEPTLLDGVFAALWTVEHAIDFAPGGIAGPVHVAVLEKAKNGYSARFLSDNELAEHKQHVGEAEDALEHFANPKTAAPLELPPKPA